MALTPASVATSGNTTATVTIEAGTLSITVPAGTVSLGKQANSVAGFTASAALGVIEVSDTRNATDTTSWATTVIVTDFIAASGKKILASEAKYEAGDFTKAGATGGTAVAGSGSLSAGMTAVSTSGVDGAQTVTWSPTMKLSVAASVPQGVYSSTVTHSVL